MFCFSRQIIKFKSIISRGLLSVSLLAFVNLIGCASFPGHDLPAYTFEDFPPAPRPEQKVCLIIHDDKNCDKECREFNDSINDMFEKSGYFLKYPEHCSPNPNANHHNLIFNFEPDREPGYMAIAVISGFIGGATFGIVPAFERDHLLFKFRLQKNDELLKEYVYREYVDTWIEILMLFKMSDHSSETAVKEVFKRVYMNFLHDFSHDFNKAVFDIEKIESPPGVSASN